ncbi:dienelactone hydrolase family protein [Peribacillus sp. NPDC096540]|uniref:dienelactone hydrolase family protein n=1 Tax=Peribacillus sp. NPDC096540 TaxID=3390612 RepID=UPI003D0704B2
MYKIQSKNNSKVIIVLHEIYGINQHVKDFCELLSEQNFDVICPNFLQREEPFAYVQEKEAYINFMDNVGFTMASNKIKKIILKANEEYSKIFIIGFSIGATIAWLCSEEVFVDGMVGYYGTRIRDYLEKVPKCPTLLLFPQEEQSVDVDGLVLHLDKENIEIHTFNGFHGFSDPFSPKYNKESAEIASSQVIKFLQMS